ncbi:hypothetical protein [Lignipirellula cremea]|uniref:Helix-turn-helix domain protein n=1 Tax=Lignipirellula cremea TaxID=2528010 RepID=A0A518DSI3_9BACT|nr:hypothetical protein [Lignipirellula cremea]QDU94806.1 hypothetical protein Pla8534_26130 [Lignipirellula cremea]
MKPESTGVIHAAELYTVNQLKARLGLTESAWRTLRRLGLPVIRVGKRAFASGRQVIEFMERRIPDAS